MKPNLALWLLLVGVAFGAEAPNAEEPAPKTNDAVVQAQPERKARKRSQASRRDFVRVGSSAELKPGDSCNDLVVVGASATVDGHVHGDLVVVGGTAKLGPTAIVRGDLVLVGGLLDEDPAASVEGERVMIGSLGGGSDSPWLRWPMEWVSKGLLWGRPLPHQFAWSWAIAGIFLLLYVGMALLFPRPVRTCVQMLEEQPGSSFLAGLLALGLFLPVVLLLIASVVGIVVVPFLIAAFVAAFFLGKVVVYSYAGQQVGSQLGVSTLQQPLPALICGAALFCLFYAIPVVGLIVWGAAAPLAVGAVTMTVMRKFRSTGAPAAEAASVPVMVGRGKAADATGAMPQSSVLLLPRVGFWLRLLATVIDAVLIVLIVDRVLHLRKWLPLAWTVYHIAMWAWLGTTVGGLVFRLKVVRTDGQPIHVAAALVRALAAFLSASALFLGFFWAGWTSSRQSWHDKIAGTAVVRMPKGVSALA
jgi:uncharacterized RDD family membrane protein YckC